MYYIKSVIILILFSHMALSADMNASKISGYQFSLLDIEQNCSAVRNGMTDTLSIECKGHLLAPVRRSCEGYIQGGLETVKLNCRGGLWQLNNRCRLEMRGAQTGEFNCKL